LKNAAIPPTENLSNNTRDKEYDAVRRTWKDMVDNDVPTISWREFQQRYSLASRQFPQTFTVIRKNRPAITQDDLKEWLGKQEAKGGRYSVTYQKYREPSEQTRDVEQLVLQLNRGAEINAALGMDAKLLQWINMVGASAAGPSGHPVRNDTVGWLRVDFVSEEWLFVEEVQSDLINSITTAKAYIAAPDYDTWYAAQNEGAKAKIDEKGPGIRQQWGMAANHLRNMVTLAELDSHRAKMVDLFKDWTETAIATIIEIARDHGIKNVAIASTESISQRDPSVAADKIKMYYDNLAKGFGFKQQHVDLGEGVSGNFWVRKTANRSYLTAR
jgi:hypothetical protein